MIDGTLHIIIFDNKTIDSLDLFLDTQNYTSTFKGLHRDKQSSRVYIHTKSSRPKKLSESNTVLESAYQKF